MPTITIKHRHTGAVLFELDVTDEQQAAGLALRVVLEAARAAGVSLAGASLIGSDLIGAILGVAGVATQAKPEAA